MHSISFVFFFCNQSKGFDNSDSKTLPTIFVLRINIEKKKKLVILIRYWIENLILR